jgi:sirohydrochlorin ferrochelatase
MTSKRGFIGSYVNSNAPWGVVLLAHGSQRGTSPRECSCFWQTPAPAGWCQHCPSTAQGLQDAAHRFQRVLGADRAQVVLACLEFIQPSPEQAVSGLAAQGCKRAVLMPYLLGHGKHATLELEEVLEALRAKFPQMQLHLAEGLGADPRLADLVVERVHALDGFGPNPLGARQTTGVLLVKAGTKTQYDDCRWLEELGQMVERRLGLGYAVSVAQSHYGDPTMEAGATPLVEERGVSVIRCVPYLFFPGMILRRNVLGGMHRLEEKYPDISMTVTPPLGVDDRLLAVAADRVREVWAQAEAAGP